SITLFSELASFEGLAIKGNAPMNFKPGQPGQQQNDGFLHRRNAWLEGKAPMPTGPLSIFESNFNNLPDVFVGSGTTIVLGPKGCDAQQVIIVNKLSGKALEFENAPINQVARTRQVTSSGAPNQRWFI